MMCGYSPSHVYKLFPLCLPRTAHLFSEEQRRGNQTVNNQEPIQHVAGDRRS